MRSFLRKFNHLVLSLAVYSLGLQPAFANLHLADQREDARASRFVSVFKKEDSCAYVRAMEGFSPAREEKEGLQKLSALIVPELLKLLKPQAKDSRAAETPREEALHECAQTSEARGGEEQLAKVMDETLTGSLSVLMAFSQTQMPVGEGYSQALAHAAFVALEDLKSRFEGITIDASLLDAEQKAQAQHIMEQNILSQVTGMALAKWMEFDNGGDSAFFQRMLGLQGFFDALSAELSEDAMAMFAPLLGQLRTLYFGALAKTQLDRELAELEQKQEQAAVTDRAQLAVRMDFADYFESLVDELDNTGGTLAATSLKTALQTQVGLNRKEAYQAFINAVAAKAGQIVIDLRAGKESAEDIHKTLSTYLERNLQAIPGVGTLTGAELTAMSMEAMHQTRLAFSIKKEDKTYKSAMALGSDLAGTSAEFVKRFTWSFLGGVSKLIEVMRGNGELESRTESTPRAHAQDVAKLEAELEDSRAVLSRVIRDALEEKDLLDAYNEAENKPAFLNENLTQGQIARVKEEIADQRAITRSLARKRPVAMMDDKKVAMLEEQRKEAVKQLQQALRAVLEGKGLWEKWSEVLDKDKPAFIQENLTPDDQKRLEQDRLRVQWVDSQLAQVYTLKPDVDPGAIYRPLGADKAGAFLGELLHSVVDISQAEPVFAAVQAHQSLDSAAEDYAEQKKDLKNLRKSLYEANPRAKLLFRALNTPGSIEQELTRLSTRDVGDDGEPLTEAEKARLHELEDFKFWFEGLFHSNQYKYGLLFTVDALVNGTPTYRAINMAVEAEETAPGLWHRFKETRVGGVVTHPLFWGALGLGALSYWDPIGPIGPQGAEAALAGDFAGPCNQISTFGCKRIVNGMSNLCFEKSPACCPNPLALTGIPGNGTGEVTITVPLPGFDVNGFPFGAEVFYPSSLPGWTINSQVVGSDRILTFEGNLTFFDQDFGCVQGTPSASVLYFQPRDSDNLVDWRVDITAGTESLSGSTFFGPVPVNDPPTVVDPFAIDPSFGNDVTANSIRTISGICPLFPFRLHDIDGAQMDNPPELQGMKILRAENFALTRGGAPFPPNTTLSGQSFKDSSVGYEMTCTDPSPWADYIFCDYDALTADCVSGSETSPQRWSQPCPALPDPENIVVSSPPRSGKEKFIDAAQIVFPVLGGIGAGIAGAWGVWTVRDRIDAANNPLMQRVKTNAAEKKFQTDTKRTLFAQRMIKAFLDDVDEHDRIDLNYLSDPANNAFPALESVSKALADVLLEHAKRPSGCFGGRFSFHMIKGRFTTINFEQVLTRMDSGDLTAESLAKEVIRRLQTPETGNRSGNRSRAWCCCRDTDLRPSKYAWHTIRAAMDNQRLRHGRFLGWGIEAEPPHMNGHSNGVGGNSTSLRASEGDLYHRTLPSDVAAPAALNGVEMALVNE